MEQRMLNKRQLVVNGEPLGLWLVGHDPNGFLLYIVRKFDIFRIHWVVVYTRY
ncbi:hypothetical protein HHA03_01940 [Halolactibacillus halophilus]|uniref:Uncharacterized protein n=1 Tax=Halolactibacillus halophilus TaxID=306540 RepID=A0ABQ0VHL8_9BACI|nr:hypothetical protein HHA03_01940 [Halolactibacillus halophilus]